MTTKEFAKILQDKLTSEYGVDLSVASHQQIYRALALICRQMMSENHKKFQSKAIGTGSKQVYYLCMEFLMGRSLKMSLFNLGLNDAAQKALAEADISLDMIEVRVTPQRGQGFDSIAERIYKYPEVRSVYLMSGAYDLMVILEGKTLREVSNFVSDKLSTLDSVLSTATHFILKKYKDHGTAFATKKEDEREMITP